jgi:hypothetical protein
MQRSRLRVPVFTWLVGILMAMFLAGAAQSAGLSLAAMTQKANAQPASAPPPAPLAQSLDQVINTLQNEGERQALVKQLQAVRTGLDASAAGAAGAASAAGASAPSPGLMAPLRRPSRKWTTRRTKIAAQCITGSGGWSSPAKNCTMP